jgi:hypothetical protein
LFISSFLLAQCSVITELNVIKNPTQNWTDKRVAGTRRIKGYGLALEQTSSFHAMLLDEWLSPYKV